MIQQLEELQTSDILHHDVEMGSGLEMSLVLDDEREPDGRQDSSLAETMIKMSRSLYRGLLQGLHDNSVIKVFSVNQINFAKTSSSNQTYHGYRGRIKVSTRRTWRHFLELTSSSILQFPNFFHAPGF